MPYTPPLTTCATCEGDGKSNGDICPECLGSGATPLIDKGSLLAKAIVSRLDSIIAEQASQREDLTAALTQIWNKVKDL